MDKIKRITLKEFMRDISIEASTLEISKAYEIKGTTRYFKTVFSHNKKEKGTEIDLSEWYDCEVVRVVSQNWTLKLLVVEVDEKKDV